MSLNVTAAVSEGFDRLTTKTGLLLVGVFAVANFALTVAAESRRQPFEVPPELEGTDAAPEFEEFFDVFSPFLDPSPVGVLPDDVAILVTIAAYIVYFVAVIAAYRVFIADEREVIPSSAYKDDMPVTFINYVVGYIAYIAAFILGLILFIIPGIVLAVLLVFYAPYIAAERRNFIDALSGSWDLTAGNRFAVFGLLVVVALVYIFLQLLGNVVYFSTFEASPFIAEAISASVSAVTTVFFIGAVAAAFVQLRGVRDESTDVDVHSP